MKSSVRLVLLLALTAFGANCDLGKKTKDREEVIAYVNGDAISKKEFVTRAEFSPPPRFMAVNGKKGKQGLLELLIAEKLMAQAGQHIKLDTSRVFQQQIKLVELNAVLRELYNDEVSSKISVDSTEIISAYHKMQQKYRIKLLQTTRRKRARKFLQSIQKGNTFEQAFVKVYGYKPDPKKLIREVTWGDLEEPLERTLFTLREGEISPVIRFSKGYAVFQVENIWNNPIATQGSFMQRASAIQKILRSRKMDRLSAKFVADFMNARQTVVKIKTFNALVRWLDTILPYKDKRNIPKLAGKSKEVYFDSLKIAFADKLGRPFITYKGGAFTLREMLYKLRLRGITLDKKSPEAMRRQLLADLKMIVRDELLGQEGYRRGLQKRTAVRKEVKMWRDFYLSREFAAATKLRLFPKRETHIPPEISFPDPLKALQVKAKIRINQAVLDRVNISSLPVIAVRPGRVASLVVPPWPE